MTDAKKETLAALKRALADGKLDTAAELLGTRRAPHDKPPEAVAPPDNVRHRILANATGAMTVAKASAACLHLQPDITVLRPDWPQIVAEFNSVMHGARQQFDELSASPGLCLAANATEDDVLLLTLAAAGGKTGPIFQAAMLQWRGNQFVMDQYLAAGPREEPAVVAAVADRLAEVPLVITFDTRPGNMSVFHKRAETCGASLPDRLPKNLNLRADIRSRMGGLMQSLSLNAAEQVLTGFRRDDRVDRRAFGKLYEHFLQTGETAPLLRAVACAQLDLLAMVKLLCVLLTGAEPYLD